MVSIRAFDKLTLPRNLYEETKVIGLRLLKRLEEEWSEEKKTDLLFPDEDYNSYMTVEEQSRLLVYFYYCDLPEDDPDRVAYHAIHRRAADESDDRKEKNKRAHERAKRRRQQKASGNSKPPAVHLPGLPQTN